MNCDVRSVNSELVGSYAMLKSIWVEGDYFAPFERLVLTLLHNKNISQITDIRSLCKEFQDYWHVDISYMAMQYLLARLINSGYANKANSTFNITIKKIDGSVLIPQREIEAYEADYDTIINDCQEYIRREFEEELTCLDINTCFASILKAQASQILVGEYQTEEVSTENKYYTSSYIAYIAEHNTSKLALLNDIAFRHILSCCISLDSGNMPKSLVGLDIYLDTTFIFHYLGIDLLDRKDVYTQLVCDLVNSGANLFVLQSNINEVHNILLNASYWVPNPQYDNNLASISSRYFKQKRWTSADILELNNELLNILAEDHITIHPGYLYPDLNSYCQDENQIFRFIKNQYKKKSPWFDFDDKEDSIKIDARTINLMLCYREGRTSQNLLECQHVFVTTNESLVKATQYYERTFMKLPNANISSCVSDSFIGLIMWLNQPTKLLEISHKRLLALAYAAFIPTDRVREEFKKHLVKAFEKGRISEVEYYTMRSLPVVQKVLMELCRGNITNITEHTPEEILERIRQDAREAERLRLEKENLVAELNSSISRYSDQLRQNEDEQVFIADNLTAFDSQLGFFKELKNRFDQKKATLKRHRKITLIVIIILLILIVVYSSIKLQLIYTIMSALATVILPIVLVANPYIVYVLTNKHTLNKKERIILYEKNLDKLAMRKSGYMLEKHNEILEQRDKVANRLRFLQKSKAETANALSKARDTLSRIE